MPKRLHLHLVSDATGETIQSVARACIAQFDDVETIEHFWNMVRTTRQLDFALDSIRSHGGAVLYTVVDDHLRQYLEGKCREAQVPAINVLEPVMGLFADMLGQHRQSLPGRQHTLDSAYFDRVDAMEYALGHDDGQKARDLHKADVVLVGVSRTSKTPTCLYLANRGVKAANVPFVPGVPLPQDLETLKRPMIVGLTKDPDALVALRRNRLIMLHQGGETAYIDPEEVRAEVMEARRYFTRRGWPIIDVTRRAIEETSAEILQLLLRRRERLQKEALQARAGDAP